MFVILSAAGAWYFFKSSENEEPAETMVEVGGAKYVTVKIGDTQLEVEIAQTNSEKARGLSGRERLAEESGMLFVFDKPAMYLFWMKNMLFSIDIIWIGKDKKIVDITHGAEPEEGEDQLFLSKGPSQYILEVNNGWAETNGIQIGDRVEFEL